jgi:hypothetical protein
MPSRILAMFGPAIAACAAWLPGTIAADEETARLSAYHVRVDRAVERGLAFLAAQQVTPGKAAETKQPYLAGSFRGWHEPGNTGIASLCVMAFLSKGYTPGEGRYGPVIDRGIDYVLSTQQKNGLLYCEKHQGNRMALMYSHAISTLLLAEASGMVDPQRQRRIDAVLPRALELLLSAQNVRKSADHAGGWRYEPTSTDSDLSLTGWAIMALRAGRLNGAPVPKENIANAVKYILKCRNKDNGFSYQRRQGSTIGLTGCAVLCLELCGEHGNAAVSPAGDFILAHLPKGNDGGMKSYYAFYYCSQAMFQLGSRHWETWAPRMYDILLEAQKPGGAWPGGEVGETYNTAMSILAMTVAYRQLPIYHRDDTYERDASGP